MIIVFLRIECVAKQLAIMREMAPWRFLSDWTFSQMVIQDSIILHWVTLTTRYILAHFERRELYEKLITEQRSRKYVLIFNTCHSAVKCWYFDSITMFSIGQNKSLERSVDENNGIDEMVSSVWMLQTVVIGFIDLLVMLWKQISTFDGAMASQITSLAIVYSIVYSRGRWKTSKLHVTDLCAGNSPVAGEFHTQRASNVKNVPIWWYHHAFGILHQPGQNASEWSNPVA